MVPVNSINKDRLEGWKEKLKKAHATAVLMVAVGHDHNSGQINIITTVDCKDEDVRLLLIEALRQIEQQITSKN